MSEIILQRINENQLADFCDKYSLDLKIITPHQYRVEGIIDFYPKRNRYFVIPHKKWGTALSLDDLRATLAESLPKLESGREVPESTIEQFKQWYVLLCDKPDSERMSGQLTMITSVLKVILTEPEFKELTEVPDER